MTLKDRHGVHLLLAGTDTDRRTKHERRARSYLDFGAAIRFGSFHCDMSRLNQGFRGEFAELTLHLRT